MDANTITTIVGFAGIISTLALGFFASFRQANTTNQRLDRLTEIVSDNRDNLMMIRGHLNIGITSSRQTPPTPTPPGNPEQPEHTTEQHTEAPMAS